MTKHIFADSYQARNPDGTFYTRVHCNSCEALSINGTPCHETGCPDAWRDELRECKECGTKFYPEESEQMFCSDSCRYAYMGLGDPYDDPNVIECRNCGNACLPYEDSEEFCSERCAKAYWG